MKIHRLIPACVLVLAACGGAQVIRSDPLGVVYEARSPAVESAEGPFEPLRAVDGALALPSLGTVVLGSSVRELRIAYRYPLIQGVPRPFLRLVESPEGAMGMLAEWRDGPEPWKRENGRPATSCTAHADEIWSCVDVLPLPGGVTWQEVADERTRLGAWTVREPCDPENAWTSESGEVVIERLDHDRYETYRCHAPTRRSGGTGKQVGALYEYLAGLVARTASESKGPRPGGA